MNDQFLQGVLFDWNRIDNDSYLTKYNKNSPTSAGSEMNCRSEHKCSKEFYKQKRKHLFACWNCIIIIKREHIVQKTMIEIIHM